MTLKIFVLGFDARNLVGFGGYAPLPASNSSPNSFWLVDVIISAIIIYDVICEGWK